MPVPELWMCQRWNKPKPPAGAKLSTPIFRSLPFYQTCSCKKMQLIAQVRKTCCAAFFQIGFNLQSNNVRKHKSKPSPPTLANTTSPQRNNNLESLYCYTMDLQILYSCKEFNLGAVLGLEAAPHMDGPKNPKKTKPCADGHLIHHQTSLGFELLHQNSNGRTVALQARQPGSHGIIALESRGAEVPPFNLHCITCCFI